MTRSTGIRQPNLRRQLHRDPTLLPIGQWLPANRGCYVDFREWLQQGGYSGFALNLYTVAARLAFGLWNKPYWVLDLENDFARVHVYLDAHYPSEATRTSYAKGLVKLGEFLRGRCQRPQPERTIHWDHYLQGCPNWLGDDVKAFLAHRQRNWSIEARYHATLDWLSPLTRPLRWMSAYSQLNSLADITPKLWFAYVDARLADRIQPRTVNAELGCVLGWLRFLHEQGRPVCERMLRVQPLSEGPRLPRDVPLDQVRKVFDAILADAESSHRSIRRMGVMDRAWFLLMLHSGLRTGEVRRLRKGDLDLPGRRLRIEQSKGLKDRIVYVSAAAVEALCAYLDLRGPGAGADDHVFLLRHLPLSESYCGERLGTYGKRCGVMITPHQLRHTCATLLLNAGAPVLTVQTILGHKHIDTTLGYARLYDGVVASDYYRAMAQVEKQMSFSGRKNGTEMTRSPGELIAMVDALRCGTLNEKQIELVQALREGIQAMSTIK